MSLEYIRKTYKVNATMGHIVKVKDNGSTGKIVGAHGAYVKVKFLMDDRHGPMVYHPMDLEYPEIDEFTAMKNLIEGWKP